MLNGCSLCGTFFGYEAVENGYLHRVGKYLICCNCVAELKDALGFSAKREDADDTEVERHTKHTFAV